MPSRFLCREHSIYLAGGVPENQGNRTGKTLNGLPGQLAPNQLGQLLIVRLEEFA